MRVLAVLCIILVWPLAAVARPAPQSFADLAEKLLPSVVNISTTQTVQARSRIAPDMPNFPEGSPFEDMFREFFERRLPPNAQPRQRQATSLGSGFIIDKDGLIITNNHVIEGADSIRVTLHDNNTTYDAEVVGRDEKTDIAVLRIKPNAPLPALRWGDSDSSRVGDWVIAIGNPFGLGSTVTAGIISARARDINAGPYDDYIQTDASINRGNSGGPMFNMQGEVIGINTAIFSPTGGSVGIGFAVPSSLARPVVQQLLEFGRTKRGWIGVEIQTVTPEIAASLGMKEPRGALVSGVVAEGPAAKAGIEDGDVIVRFNNVEIRELRVLPRTVAETPVGQRVPVVVLRNGRERSLNIVLGELEAAEEANLIPSRRTSSPSAPTPSAPSPDSIILGMTLEPLNNANRSEFSLPTTAQGVLVRAVADDSDAARRGITRGDVLLSVNQTYVKTLDEVRKAIAAARKDKRSSVLLRVQKENNRRLFVAVSLE